MPAMAQGRSRVGVAAGALIALACVAALAFEWWRAPGLPDGPPQVSRVDAALVERLRAHPGLHLPLDPAYVVEVPLDLREDRANRFLFGTTVDLREPVARLAIHIQAKDGRMAIHADRYNPLDGPVGWVLHNSADTPVVPLVLGLVFGLVLAVVSRRRGPQ
jgi:hypothetical protein